MQLFQKEESFSRMLSAFLKSRINFAYFVKKITLKADVLLRLRTPKTWSDKCLKSPVSEDLSTSNMVNGSKHC